MALKIVLLALLVYCASEAQSQGDDTSLPLSYNVTTVQGDGATCPNDQLQQETLQNIANDIGTLLRNTVIPTLGLPTPEPPTIPPECSCISGGRRIAYLNMTDPNQQCPFNWQEISAFGVRLCRRMMPTTGSCKSAFYPSNGISYSRVCGRVTGYQYCATAGFFQSTFNLENSYVDGVSITHGSPRQHVWTFAAAFTESDISSSGCPCVNTAIPSFVGNNYFCDTGYTVDPRPCGDILTDLIIDYPLWDDGRCGPNGGCCENNNPPWFCTTLPQPTTDDIEVRLCADFSHGEEVTIELIEIYVS